MKVKYIVLRGHLIIYRTIFVNPLKQYSGVQYSSDTRNTSVEKKKIVQRELVSSELNVRIEYNLEARNCSNQETLVAKRVLYYLCAFCSLVQVYFSN